MAKTPTDNPEEDQKLIAERELRAKVVREHRRGLTNKAIAGGLGISKSKVETILQNSLDNLLDFKETTFNKVFKPPTVEGTRDAVERQELAYRLREQRNDSVDTLIDRNFDFDFDPNSDESVSPKPEKNSDQSLPPNDQEEHPIITLKRVPNDILSPYWIRRRLVFRLRKQGKSYDEIYDLTGTDPNDARKMVQAELGMFLEDEFRDRDLSRRLQLERLETLFAAVWPAATREPTEEFPLQGPDLEASRQAIRILERESKLLGLDAAPKVDIEERIRRIARANGVDEDEMVGYALEAIKVRMLPSS